MGHGGYWIIIFDGWGIGLEMLNPRMLDNGKGGNWFNWSVTEETGDEFVPTQDRAPTDEEIVAHHGFTETDYFRIVR